MFDPVPNLLQTQKRDLFDGNPVLLPTRRQSLRWFFSAMLGHPQRHGRTWGSTKCGPGDYNDDQDDYDGEGKPPEAATGSLLARLHQRRV